MTRTTSEWEALLDGTTPGPWTMGADPTKVYEVVDTDLGPDFGRHILTAVVEEGVCDFDEAEANANLACEAPDAVAEVIRLRLELKNLQKWIAQFPINPVLIGTGTAEERANELQTKAVTAITLILNGALT